MARAKSNSAETKETPFTKKLRKITCKERVETPWHVFKKGDHELEMTNQQFQAAVDAGAEEKAASRS